MFNESFIQSIPEERNSGAMWIIDSFFEFIESLNQDERVNEHDMYIEYYHLLEGFLSSKDYNIKHVDFGSSFLKNIDNVVEVFVEENDFFTNKITKEKVNNSKERYSRIFGNSFVYEFAQEDIDRIQILINELREIVSKSDFFEEKHQARLLRRLEKLQSELHKKVSDVDRFWGLFGDAGIALGKFGKDAKPFFDRIREMTQIVLNTQAKAEGLPSGTSIPEISDNEKSKSQ